MEILSECRASRLTIEVVGSVFVHHPTLNLSVAVADEGFFGASDGIWVGTDEYKTFVAALHQCVQTGWGHAALASISPGKLSLQVVNADGPNCLRLDYRVCRTSYDKHRVPQYKTVTGGFDLDPERLAQHVSDFERLLSLSEERRTP